MPTKAERRVPLPAGLLPLLNQAELETYYGVSDWMVLRWIESGMPVEPMKPARTSSPGDKPERERRRFDITKVKEWQAEQPLAVSA